MGLQESHGAYLGCFAFCAKALACFRMTRIPAPGRRTGRRRGRPFRDKTINGYAPAAKPDDRHLVKKWPFARLFREGSCRDGTAKT
jgi:hypothetical protein